MAEYISRENTLDVIREMSQRYTDESLAEFAYNIVSNILAADVQPVDNDNAHIVYIGRKAYMTENTIMEFMKKMDIIRDSLVHIENYFDTYAETIRQIRACAGECTDISEVKYFIDRIKENSRYD